MRSLDWKNKTILIVEDDDISYLLLRKALEYTKVSILRATDGIQAFSTCINDNISLVLMDVKMPILDGTEATRLIKKYRADIPVIIQTAKVLHIERVKCFKVGADDYLSKPLDLQLLISKIDSFFKADKSSSARFSFSVN